MRRACNKEVKSGGCIKFLVICLMLCGLADLLYSSYSTQKYNHYQRLRRAIPDNVVLQEKDTIRDTLLFSNDTVYVDAFFVLHGGDSKYKKRQLVQIEQLLSTEGKVLSVCENRQEVIHKLMETNWKDVVDDDTNTITCYRERYTISQIESLPGLNTYCLYKEYEWGDGLHGNVSISESRGTYIDSISLKVGLEDFVKKERIDEVLSITRDHILVMCSERRDTIASGWTENNTLLHDKNYLSGIACFTKKGILFIDTMWPLSIHILLPYDEINECIDPKFTQAIHFTKHQ